MIPQQTPAERIEAHLSIYLGPHTARVAVKTFSLKALGHGPEALTPKDVPVLLAALRPMLRTLVGKARCEQILDDLTRELGA